MSISTNTREISENALDRPYLHNNYEKNNHDLLQMRNKLKGDAIDNV